MTTTITPELLDEIEAKAQRAGVDTMDQQTTLALVARIRELDDEAEALDSELTMAVEVAYRHGAHEWARLNFPSLYEELSGVPARENQAPAAA